MGYCLLCGGGVFDVELLVGVVFVLFLCGWIWY